MIQALRMLRLRPESFLSALRVFAEEPTVDWLKLARLTAKKKGVSEALNAENFAAKKVALVRAKLLGKHPVGAGLLELEHGFNEAKAKELLPHIKQLLLGRDGDCKRGGTQTERETTVSFRRIRYKCTAKVISTFSF